MSSSGTENWFDTFCRGQGESERAPAHAAPIPQDVQLGELAVAGGLLTRRQLDEALSDVVSMGGSLSLGQVLVRRGWITTSQLASLLQLQAERALPDDRYELFEELDRGGMAVVYRARDRKLGREVALKILRREFAHSPAAVSRMIREARIVASLDHPHIVHLYDIGDERTPPYLVMELLRGRTMERALKDPKWALHDRVRALEQVTRAVSAAHQNGIVHRDLKPGNIMLEGPDRAVVMDFGLAHLASSVSALTRTGVVVGTPMYMAPEQVRGDHGLIDARTDVYALGVMLYEAVTGKLPFPTHSARLWGSILTREAVPMRRLNPRVPVDLETICLRAMARERDLRYASAADLADDLGRFIRGEPILARRPSIGARLWRYARRRAGPLAVAVLIAALGTVIAAQRRRSPAPPEPAPLDVAGLCERAQFRKAGGDFRGALEDYEAVLRMSPDFGPAYLYRAAIHQAQGDENAMMADLDQAIARMEAEAQWDTPYVEARVMRGERLFRTGFFDRAVKDLTRALERRPENVRALSTRALCYCKLKRYHECVRDLDLVKRHTPELPDALRQTLAEAKQHQPVEVRYVLDYSSGKRVTNMEVVPPEAPLNTFPGLEGTSVVLDKIGRSVVVRFQVPVETDLGAVLELEHLSGLLPEFPHGGSAAISVFLNGEPVVRELRVGEHHFHNDRLGIGTGLRKGGNEIEVRLEAGLSKYWLSRLEVQCFLPPGTKVPPQPPK